MPDADARVAMVTAILVPPHVGDRVRIIKQHRALYRRLSSGEGIDPVTQVFEITVVHDKNNSCGMPIVSIQPYVGNGVNMWGYDWFEAA